VFRSIQGAAFKDFCEAPENREVMKKHQQKEVRQMAKATAKNSALDFRDKVGPGRCSHFVATS
jgi:hypothetical protein